MTRPDIAVVGGGLFGRCLAWRASRLVRASSFSMLGAAKEKIQLPGWQRA